MINLYAVAQMPSELFEKAQKAFHENNFQEVIQITTQLLEQQPKSPQVYNLRGLAKYALSDFEGSIQDYTQAISLQPTFKEALYNRGVSYYWLNKDSQAEADFFAALKIDTADARIYTALGSLYSRKSELSLEKKKQKIFWQKAESAYQKALSCAPRYALAYYNYALLLSETYPTKALQLIDSYLSLQPENAQGYFLKATLLQKKRKYSDAITCFEKSLQINPHNAEAFCEVGYLYYKFKDKPKACLAWQKAQSLGCVEANRYLRQYCQNVKN